MTSLPYKILGGTLLLLSYVCQNYIYDYWDGKEKSISQSMTQRAIVDRGAELYHVLYYVANNSDESLTKEQFKDLRTQFIRQAAIKNSYGISNEIFTSNLTVDKKSELASYIGSEAAKVNDNLTFSKYILNSIDLQKNTERTYQVLMKVQAERDFARTIFLSLNILGSILLLLGLLFEKK